jgi:protocatechuate 3,4-dioxygenase beta subunit
MRTVAVLALVLTLGAASSAGPAPVVLAGPNEPGERLAFGGRILDKGKPVAGAKVLAYHTDRTGLYNDPAAHARTPRLRGTATTDPQGRFAFSTIRPAPYPGNEIPAHIHLEITVPGRRVHYVTYWFDDDPIVTPEKAKRDPEVVIVHATRGASGAWSFSNDVALPAAP